MCKCTETQGFQQKLSLAKQLTASTGETHVVFAKEKVNQVFVCKESDLSDALEICCYFLPSGLEVVYVKKTVDVIAKKK